MSKTDKAKDDWGSFDKNELIAAFVIGILTGIFFTCLFMALKQ